MAEIYEIPQGKIVVAHSGKKLSVGLLVLKSNQELDKHKRPVMEQLTQIKGKCKIRLMEGEELVDQVILKEGDQLEIPSSQFHVHSNPFDEESVTLWKFEGNIAEVIDGIRKNSDPKKIA